MRGWELRPAAIPETGPGAGPDQGLGDQQARPGQAWYALGHGTAPGAGGLPGLAAFRPQFPTTANWIMRLPSSCAVIAGTVSLPRSPALLDAGQFFSAHVLRGVLFFESRFSKKSQPPAVFKNFQRPFIFIFLEGKLSS